MMHDRERRRRKHRRRRENWGYLAIIAVLLSVILFLGRLLAERPDRIAPEGGGHYVSMSAQSLEQTDEDQVSRNDAMSDDDKLDYIFSHPELYPEVLQELAEKNDETLDYVYRYPKKRDQTPKIDLSDEVVSGEIPLLLQWDERWGYLNYGDGLMGYTGCGPTCLSMVVIGLTGNVSVTPNVVARYAEENGHYIAGSGSTWSLMQEGCEAFGLHSRELPLNRTTVIRALEGGQPVICSMRAGDFTDGGHFIILTGYQDGTFFVNDPNSRENSAKGWSWERLEGQIKNLWAYSTLAHE